MKRRVEVVGAVIVDAGHVFCTKRGPGRLAGKWEFPGGKIEPGEDPAQALVREIQEELGCSVSVGDVVTTTEYEYDFGIVSLTTFYCELAEGEPRLTEHIDAIWLASGELLSLDWAPADRPAVDEVRRFLS